MTLSQIREPVYSDEHLIVVNKPSGLLCVPGLTEPENLYDSVLTEFPNARVVHRLDMATSGLVIFALSYEAQRELGKLFEQRKVSKKYIAVVHGILDSHYGEIHSPMMCDWINRPKQKIDWLSGKKASTFYKTLATDNNKNQSRLLLSPHTGRSHQLRLHTLQLGHPILGDKLYSGHLEAELETAPARMHLHAQSLQFIQPMTGKKIKIDCQPEF
ncbi:RluA family pseudouridine synthase [Teredinibacter sp. KSP-S5-2]|uniref:RluA family pseudouridine synthase n=1 Tax=Teredinibacter sp. KSP-S5-2 TaxID=3034506 RepID=UPI002934CDBD|nr:RluA family pseudouridine synthase [Teredinibacter sp. KSP-S5-2]WNO10931.1 RluA family pseudouridine synthase [Teredinibacter sp. KSP-S5-2]